MLHSLSRACTFAALCGLLWVPTVAWGQDHRVRHVQDDAGLFTQAARDRANAIVAQIADRHHKELFVETVKEGPADAKERAAWSKTRFNNYKMDGVYIVFSKEPKFFRIEVGNKTREMAYFGAENVRKLEEIIKAKQSADDMLTRIADYTLDTMNQHPPKKGNVAPKGRPVAQPQPVVQQREHDESAMPGWVGWVCLIVGVLLVVWVIFAVIRSLTGMMGGGYGGGYGGGGGGGGGGFLTGMLGGMFGAMAGMWMYNNFFGGHANYNTGDWGGGAGAGSMGYDGDTGTGASGGGDDWGGGGGDNGAADGGAGGKDDGGGDWGGKGDRGDDAGGGGWFGGGGGDAGGGDAGGGDAGGCGGGGCGGGGGD